LDVKDKKRNIKCPNPAHIDKRPSSHIYNNNRVYCFTCGKQYSVVDIIKFKKLDKRELLREIVSQYSREELEEVCKDEKIVKKDIKKVENEDFIDFTRRYFQAK
jgi:hypothetical protein